MDIIEITNKLEKHFKNNFTFQVRSTEWNYVWKITVIYFNKPYNYSFTLSKSIPRTQILGLFNTYFDNTINQLKARIGIK